MMTAKESAELARKALDAFDKHDLDQIEKLFADNSETLTVPTGEKSIGPKGARRDTERWLTAFPDMHLEVIELLSGDDSATVEMRISGTNTGPLSTPDGVLPATGNYVEERGCMVFRFKDGKIVSEHDYFDLDAFKRQLGVDEKAPQRVEQQPTM